MTLVPDNPDQLTSDHGWDLKSSLSQIKDFSERFKSNNIRTSIFLDPDQEQLEIAKEIKAKDFPVSANLKERFGKGGKLSNSKDFWSKSRAGELGVAIGGVNQTVVQKRLIQNLYDVAASIAYATGLTPTEQILARRVGDITSFTKDTSRNVQFRSGPYIKVY